MREDEDGGNAINAARPERRPGYTADPESPLAQYRITCEPLELTAMSIVQNQTQ
jgi:hypothetical protein